VKKVNFSKIKNIKLILFPNYGEINKSDLHKIILHLTSGKKIKIPNCNEIILLYITLLSKFAVHKETTEQIAELDGKK
jgi:hypothetical protein